MRARRAVLAGLLVAAACGHDAPSSPAPGRAPEPEPGGAALAARLAALAAAAEPERDPYLSDARAELFRAQAEAAPKGSHARLQARVQMAIELCQAGRPLQAADELTAIHERLVELGDAVPAGLRRTVRRQLALAWLRVAEDENCVARHTSDSCLVPISGAGVHGVTRGAENALALYAEALVEQPDDVEARWLYNLAAMTLGRWPEGVPEAWCIPASAFASQGEVPRFPDTAAARGLDLRGLSGGCAMEDFDGDGRLDLLVSSWGDLDPLALMIAQPDGSFVDRAAQAGLDGITGGLNLVHADYDNDGDADVLVLRGAWRGAAGRIPNSLLRNDGEGRFQDVTVAAGLYSEHPTQTAAWVDLDGDGWLDLYIGNESSGEQVDPCELFLSNGDGSFTECAADAGIAHVGYVKSVAAGDFDDDGRPDLYLSRSDGPNALYRNLGAVGDAGGPARGLRFIDVAREAGVRHPLQSFPSWFFDYDNDGHLDLFVCSYRALALGDVASDVLGETLDEREVPLSKLYRNRGDGSFEDVSGAAGLSRPFNAMGANWGDLDHDGFPDIYLGTGEPDLGALYPNRMLRNDGGRRFLDVTTAGGFGHLQKGHGIAWGDLDGDGDQDIHAVMGGAFRGDAFMNALFENPGNDNAWVTLRLVGTRSNRAAIGARLAVRIDEDGTQRDIHTLVGTGGSFGSSTLQTELGLGRAQRIVSVTVQWPGGATQVWTDLTPRRTWTLIEGETAAR